MSAQRNPTDHILQLITVASFGISVETTKRCLLSYFAAPDNRLYLCVSNMLP